LFTKVFFRKGNIPSGIPGRLSKTSATAVDASSEMTASDKLPPFKSEASIAKRTV
jgi:hypothetical protein